MIAGFFDRLRGRKPEEELPELDARLAMGALLVRLAKADEHYAFEEIAQIDKLISDFEDMNAIEAAKLRATCEKLEADAPDTETFTALVQDNVPYAARTELYGALWQVSLADRILKPEEEVFLSEISKALAIREADEAATAARYGRGA
ncbi:MAG: TerB family tellurite resistance protein [Maritimibacter sp.]|jgi:uncharacterized tellurite resistance protein B-like protein